MYTKTTIGKYGIVTITKTDGNIPIAILATRDDGGQWEVKNSFGIMDTDRHEAEEFVGGIFNGGMK